jgi:predicted kinase
MEGEGMKKLVMLVGLPGSGKTAFQERHPEWAIVSKDAIRRGIFHCDFAPEYEDTVDRVFASTLVEVIDSNAEVVCVDDLNLARSTRRELIELAQLSGREAIAYVMPFEPVDELFARTQQGADAISSADPNLRVTPLPRERFDELVRTYERVDQREGFARVEWETRLHGLEAPPVSAALQRGGNRRRRIERREPLPLFVP